VNDKYHHAGEVLGVQVLLKVDPHAVLDPAEAKLAAMREAITMAFREVQGAPDAIDDADSLADLRAKAAGLRGELLELDRLIAALPAAWTNRYREEQARLLREGRQSASDDLSSLEGALRSCVVAAKAHENSPTAGLGRRLWDEAFESRISVPGAGLNLKKAAAILKEWWLARSCDHPGSTPPK
jgi:hypothetical protein